MREPPRARRPRPLPDGALERVRRARTRTLCALLAAALLLAPALAQPRPCRELIDLYTEVIERGASDAFITDVPTAASVSHFARDLAYLCDQRTLPPGEGGSFGAPFISSTYDFLDHASTAYHAVTRASEEYSAALPIEGFGPITASLEDLSRDRGSLANESFEHPEVSEVLEGVAATHEDICFVCLSVTDSLVEGEANVCRQAEVLALLAPWSRTCGSAKAPEFEARHHQAVEGCANHTANARLMREEAERLASSGRSSPIPYLRMVRLAQAKSDLESARRSALLIGEPGKALEDEEMFADVHVDYRIASMEFESAVQVVLVSLVLLTGVVALLYMRYAIVRRREEESLEL